jgi:antitoxin VapB
MALSIKDKQTDRLAREVAALTGETLTDAIRKALAVATDDSLLFKGNYFAQTDIRPALPRPAT